MEGVNKMNAYNRTKKVELESHDSFSQENIVVLRKTSKNNDKIEITQQQASRFFALLLVALFIIFLGGFTLGKYRTVKHDRGQYMPSLYSILSETTPMMAPSLQTGCQILESEYGRFATFEEADKLCRSLRKNGTISQVVMHNSYTASGRGIAHYVVCQETSPKKLILENTLQEQGMEHVKKGVDLND
jgi:hypothetical protein